MFWTTRPRLLSIEQKCKVRSDPIYAPSLFCWGELCEQHGSGAYVQQSCNVQFIMFKLELIFLQRYLWCLTQATSIKGTVETLWFIDGYLSFGLHGTQWLKGIYWMGCYSMLGDPHYFRQAPWQVTGTYSYVETGTAVSYPIIQKSDPYPDIKAELCKFTIRPLPLLPYYSNNFSIIKKSTKILPLVAVGQE